MSSYQKHLVDLVNQDPDYVVDVLGISSWELVHAFGDKVEAFIEEEYGVRPKDARDLAVEEEEVGYDDDDEDGEWPDEDEEDDD